MNDIATAADARDYFNQRAETWEEERKAYYSDQVRDSIIAAGRFQPGDVIVDFGAGSGYVTKALLNAKVGKVIALDVSPNMLITLQQTYGSAVEVRLCVDAHLPLDSGTADGIATNMTLHHLEEPEIFFRECARVLRPNGKVIVTDLIAYDATDFAQDQHDRWAGFDLETVSRWMREAGLLNCRVEPIGQKCCAAVEAASGGADIFLAHAESPG